MTPGNRASFPFRVTYTTKPAYVPPPPPAGSPPWHCRFREDYGQLHTSSTPQAGSIKLKELSARLRWRHTHFCIIVWILLKTSGIIMTNR